MTREEAAEVILSGINCLRCSTCDGEGWTFTDDIRRDFCDTCSGVGAIRHPEYEEATIILDIDYPDSIDWVLDDD